MTEEHKELIEFIISEFKKSEDGRLLKTDFAKLIADRSKRDLIGNFIVDELFLVRVENFHNLILTIDGWEFTSYKDIEAKQLALIERENAELENLKISTKVNKFFLKTKWLPHTVSIISVAFSIYVYFDAKADLKKLEQRLEVLEKIKK